MPVDAATARDGDTLYDHARHSSHWETCAAAAQHRVKPTPPTAPTETSWKRIKLILPLDTPFPLSPLRCHLVQGNETFWLVTYTRAELHEALFVARAIEQHGFQSRMFDDEAGEGLMNERLAAQFNL